MAWRAEQLYGSDQLCNHLLDVEASLRTGKNNKVLNLDSAKKPEFTYLYMNKLAAITYMAANLDRLIYQHAYCELLHILHALRKIF